MLIDQDGSKLLSTDQASAQLVCMHRRAGPGSRFVKLRFEFLPLE